jgi:ribosome recycling factor
MTEELNLIFDTTRESMTASIDHLERELLTIRAGRANPEMLHNVKVDYYGSIVPLSQVSNINTPDARTLTVQPWEKNMIQPIEKAIMNANLGLNPTNNGDFVIINIPPLTEERRKDLVKQARAEAEHARVSLRNARRDANDEIKQLQKDGLSEDLAKDAEEQVQALTNQFSEKVDNHLERKEKEIMTV